MKNRRDFIKRASLLAGAGLIAQQMYSSFGASVTFAKNMGLQLYSLRDMVGKSGIQAVLEAVAKIGYKNLETAGYSDGQIYGLAPADFKKRVNDLGMQCTSAHLGQSYSKAKEAEVMGWWDKAIEAHLEAGAKYMVQASMPVNERSKLDELKTYCDYFSAIGKRTAAAGITFGYHNHTVEFKKIGDQVILDYMLNNVSKDQVCFELDVYWCHEGGADPAEYLKKYPGQFRLTHIKDAKEIGASGKMNFKAIFDQMNANHVKDWYVEIEEYTNNDPVASAQQSFDFLNKAGYVM
ncbi:MAG: sugar phosphate isomerase/epimerase [Bacteroidia bacterium]|nr:sugar phosphate isomerase/epimerase [Bacteroidia bacterium]